VVRGLVKIDLADQVHWAYQFLLVVPGEIA
jgi:hypothetical protein